MNGELFAASTSPERLDVPDADLWLLRRLDLGEPDDKILARLVAETTWRTETVRMWDKVYEQPRRIAWHGDPGASYEYSGKRFLPEPWTPLLLDLRARVEAAAGERFNSVLVNWYRDHRDSVSWHADDEPELGPDPVIASLSLGETRVFAMRHREDRSQKPRRFELPSGSLLLMKGPTQRRWLHAVPKSTRPCGSRVNLTFRRIVNVAR